MTQSEATKTNVYEVDVRKGKIEERSLADVVNDYGADETTTPRGVAPRWHIRKRTDWFRTSDDCEHETEQEAIEWANEQSLDDKSIEKIAGTYDLWTWGVRGNNPRYIESFDTEDEVNERLFGIFYDEYLKSENLPPIFDTREEAEEWLKENSK